MIFIVAERYIAHNVTIGPARSIIQNGKGRREIVVVQRKLFFLIQQILYFSSVVRLVSNDRINISFAKGLFRKRLRFAGGFKQCRGYILHARVELCERGLQLRIRIPIGIIRHVKRIEQIAE
ncbi:hypothetical protein SDC9_130360 [bioreactor metagenome]|uniref:Uncharacterized protein n=1 Tax=bioreactor metagenome TaxID=1076179 RepID=A0A645D1Q7_9ZZZZ